MTELYTTEQTFGAQLLQGRLHISPSYKMSEGAQMNNADKRHKHVWGRGIA